MNSDSVFTVLFAVSIFAVPYLAHIKGRRWLLWLLPTFFLGPLMLICIILMKKREGGRDFGEVYQGGGLSENLNFDYKAPVAQSAANPDAGYVYVISNPSLPANLIKIGFTERDPSERLKELDQAGLPTEYIEHYRIYTQDARKLEKRLHQHFADQRFRKDKEFFTVTPHQVYEVLQSWGVKSLEL